MFKLNTPELKNQRKILRQRQTVPERKIWSIIRNRQIFDLKFYRQYSVGKYILDFYCPSRRIGIEIDGGQHNEAKNQTYDEQRTDYLQQQGIKIIRFWNNEVIENIEGVGQKLLELLK